MISKSILTRTKRCHDVTCIVMPGFVQHLQRDRSSFELTLEYVPKPSATNVIEADPCIHSLYEQGAGHNGHRCYHFQH